LEYKKLYCVLGTNNGGRFLLGFLDGGWEMYLYCWGKLGSSGREEAFPKTYEKLLKAHFIFFLELLRAFWSFFEFFSVFF
jgi:hypothetical protein